MPDAPSLLFSPRVLVNPEPRHRTLTFYEECFDSSVAAANIDGMSAKRVQADLKQLGIELLRGGHGENRSRSFYQKNRPEDLGRLRGRLLRLQDRRTLLIERGLFTAKEVDILERKIGSRAFVGAATCRAADYYADLMAALRVGDLQSAAAEPGYESVFVDLRLGEMGIDPLSLGDRSNSRVAKRLTALQRFLKLAVMVEEGA